MKARVLLDVDGVLADFYYGFAEYLNAKHGCSLDPGIEPEYYELEDWGHGAENVDFDEASRDWILGGGFLDLPMFGGAAEFVKKLSGMCQIYIVTARVGDWNQKFGEDIVNKIKADTFNWLVDHDIPSDSLYFIQEKVPFCEENGIRIMIEDKMTTALKASKAGIHTVLMNRGYNGSQIDRFKIYRMYNFDEALDQIQKLVGG